MRDSHPDKLIDRRKVVLATFLAFIAMSFSSGVGLADTVRTTAVSETANLRLTSPEPLRQLDARALLRLQISDRGIASFQVDASAEGDGLIQNMVYDLWLAESESALEESPILLDLNRAREECDEDPDTGEEEDCEQSLELRGLLRQSPFDVTTLEGLTIVVRGNLISRGGTRSILLTGTVTRADIVR